MVVKIFKVVWFLSLLAVLSTFLYVYASMPEEIRLMEGELDISTTRNGLFYGTLMMLTVFNALALSVAFLNYNKSAFFAGWFYGLVTFLHAFIIVVLQFLSLYNSLEKFNYERIGLVIYASLTMVVVWFISWPVYSLISRFSNKPTV